MQKAFKKKNIQTLVIDLRDNGGGYLTAATDILDLFFTSDEVNYQMKEKNRDEKKKEKKNPPLLFNLAELQNECSKRFKISPD